MQYLLTKEEYSDLTPKTELHRRDDALEASSRLILELSGFKCRHRRGGSFRAGTAMNARCTPSFLVQSTSRYCAPFLKSGRNEQ